MFADGLLGRQPRCWSCPGSSPPFPRPGRRGVVHALRNPVLPHQRHDGRDRAHRRIRRPDLPGRARAASATSSAKSSRRGLRRPAPDARPADPFLRLQRGRLRLPLAALSSAATMSSRSSRTRTSPDEKIWFKTPALAARAKGVPVHTPDKVGTPEWLDRIAQMRPDLILSVYYRNMISTKVLGLAPLGAFNMHGSPPAEVPGPGAHQLGRPPRRAADRDDAPPHGPGARRGSDCRPGGRGHRAKGHGGAGVSKGSPLRPPRSRPADRRAARGKRARDPAGRFEGHVLRGAQDPRTAASTGLKFTSVWWILAAGPLVAIFLILPVDTRRRLS